MIKGYKQYEWDIAMTNLTKLTKTILKKATTVSRKSKEYRPGE